MPSPRHRRRLRCAPGVRALPALAWVMAVSGCVAPPGPMPTAPPAGTRFDGLYQGESQLIRGSGYLCGPPAYAEAVTISQGTFAYPFPVNPPRTAPLPAQVAADGSVEGQLQYVVQDYDPRANVRRVWATLSGRISGAILEAIVVDERCSRRLLLQRR
jgi:hypothetical protein